MCQFISHADIILRLLSCFHIAYFYFFSLRLVDAHARRSPVACRPHIHFAPRALDATTTDTLSMPRFTTTMRRHITHARKPIFSAWLSLISRAFRARAASTHATTPFPHVISPPPLASVFAIAAPGPRELRQYYYGIYWYHIIEKVFTIYIIPEVLYWTRYFKPILLISSDVSPLFADNSCQLLMPTYYNVFPRASSACRLPPIVDDITTIDYIAATLLSFPPHAISALFSAAFQLPPRSSLGQRQAGSARRRFWSAGAVYATAMRRWAASGIAFRHIYAIFHISRLFDARH